MFLRRRRFEGFTLAEAAVALVALAVLVAAGVAASRQAQVEFEHNQNRLVLQNLASAATADAAARGGRFEEALLQSYLEGRSGGVSGVASIVVGAASESDSPGEVAAILSDDGAVLSLAMRSSRGRCLQTQAASGALFNVESQTSGACSPITPAATAG